MFSSTTMASSTTKPVATVSAMAISVETLNGTVMLSGFSKSADEKAAEAATKGEPLSYTKFLAHRRQMASQRQTDEGRAGLLGGDAGDAFLAGRGASSYSARPMASPGEVIAQRQRNQQREADYWTEARKRNAGLAQRDADEKKQQQTYVIPKGDIVVTSPAVAHRMGSVFKDPDTYKPERFAEKNRTNGK